MQLQITDDVTDVDDDNDDDVLIYNKCHRDLFQSVVTGTTSTILHQSLQASSSSAIYIYTLHSLALIFDLTVPYCSTTT